MRSHWVIGTALLFAASTAAAGQHRGPRAVRVGELGNVTLEADRGMVTGDIEVDGELVGSFEYGIRKAEVKGGELVLTGALRATVGTDEEELRGVTIMLSDTEDECGGMAATPQAIGLDDLNLSIDPQPVDLDLEAQTARGHLLAGSLCSASHLLDDPEGPLAQSAHEVLALANRALKTPPKRPASLANAAVTTTAPADDAQAEQPTIVRVRKAQPAAAAQAPVRAAEAADDQADDDGDEDGAQTAAPLSHAIVRDAAPARPARTRSRVAAPRGTQVQVRPVDVQPVEGDDPGLN